LLAVTCHKYRAASGLPFFLLPTL